ncbi:MAG: Gfo/Idh/MocA family oxidoreductase [Oscillospiraceae bacterium]|nr:Gfo/Idh/MocA family oxidoreductase [Oscillospiraceae bacterium]
MDEKPKIRTAILGYGRSGSTLHADAIEKSGDFVLTDVCDIDEKARNAAVRRFQCRAHEDYRTMAKRDDIDLIVIVTRSHQHCEMTCECLAAGKNVLVTKPWAQNAGEAEKMIAMSKESGKLLLPWLPARWGGDLMRLRELVNSGIIGKIFQVRRSQYIFSARHDWQTLKKCGGGYLLNWGPHLVDQPIQLAGSPVKSVYAEMRQIINPGDVEDVFYAAMKTENGITVISENNVAAPKLPNWVVQGDAGTIFAEGSKIEIHRATPIEPKDKGGYGTAFDIEISVDEKSLDNSVNPSNLYGDALDVYSNIAGAIRGTNNYDVTLESALRLTRVMDAIRLSGEKGQVVYL